MADLSNASSTSRHELRQKLEKMKKAYAQTLRKVQKSEKAQRTRSHVQRVIAEQCQVTRTDAASPSCTRRPSRRSWDHGDVATKPGPVSSSETGALTEELAIHKDEGSKSSTLTTKRMQRKRRSVSFSIPKENAPAKTPNAQVGAKESHLKDSETTDRPADISPSGLVVQAPPSSARPDDAARDASRLGERVTLVIPESQIPEPIEGNSDKGNRSLATTPRDLPDTGRGRGSTAPSGHGKLNGAESDRRLLKSVSPSLEEEERLGDQSRPANIQSHAGGNGKTTDGQARSPSRCLSSPRARPGRGTCKSQRRRSRAPRQLTAADVSLKEVVESQSTEEGSHTWIKGLMYPAEYYVRRTRSMTSTQSCQSRSNIDRSDAWTYSETCPTPRARVAGPPSETSGSFQDSLSQGTANPTSVGSPLTETGASVPKTHTDSMKSQLSPSLLKVYPNQAAQEGTDRNTKTSRIRRLQIKQGAASAPRTDTESASSVPSDSLVKSVGAFPAGQLLPTVAKVKLPQTEFVLPEEDYGELKLFRLRSVPVVDVSACSSDLRGRPEGIPDRLAGSQSTCMAPKIEDVGPTARRAAIRETKSDSESRLSLPLANPLNCLETLRAPVHLAAPGSIDSGQGEENIATEMTASSPEASKVEPSRRREVATTRTGHHTKESSPTIRRTTVGREVSAEPPGRSVLESQLSPTQYKGDGSKAVPVASCTPGWSPTGTPDGPVHQAAPVDLLLSSSRDESASRRCQNEQEHEGLVSEEAQSVQLQTSSDDDGSNCEASALSGPRHSGALPESSLRSSKVYNPGNSGGDASPSSSPSSATSSGLCRQQGASLGGTQPEADSGNPKPGSSTSDVNPAGGDIASPDNVAVRVSVDPRGNIQQTSPFAGVATGTPPGRAEEPKATSQCQGRVSSEEDVETPDETGRGDRYNLALTGCLLHDLPWEGSPTARDVAGGRMLRRGQDVDLLVVLYQRTLVVWCSEANTSEWQILRSWVVPQEEEFRCARFLPCSEPNLVSLVVAGVFAACSIRVVSYDTVTRETQQLDVNLPQSCESPVPHLFCVTGEEAFAVAVKDAAGSSLFLVHASIDSSVVRTVKLWTGAETSLTSLLQVEGAQSMLTATTEDNELMLWNCKNGELMKDIPMNSVDGRSGALCLKAVAEAGLLFLVLMFHDDVGERRLHCGKPIGATVAVNPVTDKMATLVEFEPSVGHAHASFVDAVIHKRSLLAKLTDGSLHQWDLFSGDLMNYSSLQPANQSMRSAFLCRSEVVLLGTDLCQQVYSA